MPADYSSTARALAVPTSPLPSPSERNTRPSFRRNPSSRRTLPSERSSYKESILHGARVTFRKVLSTWESMSQTQRIVSVTGILIMNVIFVLAIIYSHRIFAWLGPAAEKWRKLPGGWLILWAIIFASAFPPLIGYSTALTVAGFVFGVPRGWLISATANVIGSLVSFIASRTVLSKYVHRLVGDDRRFHALALTLKHDGLKILIMIRLCPLPYSLSNGALSTFPTLHPLQFALATLCATPKLAIHVFIGSRLGSLAESGEKMDTTTKIVNYVSIIGGIVLGAVVGYVIYQRTVRRAAELEAEENQVLTRTSGGGDDELEGFFDEELQGAEGMGDDDISLWDHDGDQEYRDDSTDEDKAAIGKGNIEDEEAARRARL